MKPFRFTLTFSILASLVCLLGLTWILLSLISFKTAEQDLLALKSEEVRVLLESFITVLPENMAGYEERGAAGRFVSSLARERDFAGLLLVDERGEPVYSFPAGQVPDSRLWETLGSGVASSQFSRNGPVVSRYAPVRSGGRTIGAARLSLSLVGEYERLRRSRHVFFAYFVLDFLLLFGFGSYLLSRIVLVPIKRLLTATERIAEGDYGHAVKVPGSAEIAELAESFTHMQEALKNKHEEAASHVASLERANRALKEAREETIRSEKMASVGLLAAGMAHEIGTPLAAIIGYAGILRDDLRDDTAADDYLRRIEDGAARIDRIVRGLLDYARPTELAGEDIDIGTLVRNTVELFADQGGFGKIETSLRIEEALPPVHADRHQLQQVLINLFLNARDAMPGGGEITVTASRGEIVGGQEGPDPDSLTVVRGGRREDSNPTFGSPRAGGERAIPCVRLEVRDTGEGIGPENLARVFDPFFTTKEPGKGTGLGLAICARIVDTFRGRISVASAPGEGTAFTLWLPTVEGNYEL